MAMEHADAVVSGGRDDPELSGLSDVVSTSSTPRQIADHIIFAVASGALPEGSKLPPERALAESLEVSRSSVRAALDKLERSGVVVRRRGRGGGTFIGRTSSLGAKGYSQRLAGFRAARRDLLDARAIVQNRIAATAAQRRTEEDVERLRACADEYAGLGQAGPAGAAEARAADARLHHAIAQAGRSPELTAIAVDLDRRINAGFRHDPFSAQLFAQADRDHRAIIDAIAAGDPERAGALCEEHFRTTTMGGASAS